SQISWVMHLIFNLHMMSLDIMSQDLRAEFPEDAQAIPFRGALPHASRGDHEHLRQSIILPYILACPSDFSIDGLHGALLRNRVSNALLELCPPEFARP